MGKGGRGGKAPVVAAPSTDSDDALLEAAIAENAKLKAEQEAQAVGSSNGNGSSNGSGSSKGETPPARALTRDEIVEKLNAVPTFCILNGESNIVGLQDTERPGLEVCWWFTDAEDGKEALAAAKANNPDVPGLHLGVTPLGIAFALANGWAETSFYGDMRLGGSREPWGGGQDVGPMLREQLQSEGLEAGGWQLPVFCTDELQSPTAMPVFLSRKALVEAWVTSGRKIGDLPANLTMMDVRLLVHQMQTDGVFAWSTVHFLTSRACVNLVQESRAAAIEARKRWASADPNVVRGPSAFPPPVAEGGAGALEDDEAAPPPLK